MAALEQLNAAELLERVAAGRERVRQAKIKVRSDKAELHEAAAQLKDTEEQCRRRGISLVVVDNSKQA